MEVRDATILPPRPAGLFRENDTQSPTMAAPVKKTAPDQEKTAAEVEPAALDWLDGGTIARVEAALRNRTVYRDAQPGEITLVQTHISSVFLTPGHVFKFKRPVDLGFADFRRLARRRHFCRQEVTLNRRLAADVYLDVLPLTAAGEGFAVAGDGPEVDAMVVMRRLPAAGMMDTMLAAGKVTEAHLDTLARALAAFHARPAERDDIARFGGMVQLAENWRENFEQVAPHIGTLLSAERFAAIRDAVEGFMQRHRGILQAREDGGFIRDGHGDLRCEHIQLEPALRVIDCIEFNDRFRYGDTANDLAFLLMDLVMLGHPRLARGLLARYVQAAEDPGTVALSAFYACYRAFVRGKVLGFKLADQNLAAEEREQMAARARAFFALAARFAARMGPPVLFLVCGLMGSGKSALAQGMSGHWGIPAHNSDALRKELAAAEAAAAPENTRAADFGAGIYTAQWTARTYEALLARAEAALAAGSSVILDASYSRQAHRAAAVALAGRYGADWYLVECRLPERLLRERLARRASAGNSISDGRVALLPAQQAAYEPFTDIPPERHIVVDTSGDKQASLRQVTDNPRLTVPAPLFSE